MDSPVITTATPASTQGTAVVRIFSHSERIPAITRHPRASASDRPASARRVTAPEVGLGWDWPAARVGSAASNPWVRLRKTSSRLPRSWTSS